MKRIKIGFAVIFLTVGAYFVISYGIFLFKKSSVDTQLQSAEKKVVVPEVIKPQETVVIQRIVQENLVDDQSEDDVLSDLSDEAFDNYVTMSQDDVQDDELVVTSEPENPLPSIKAEQEREFIIRSDSAVEDKNLLDVDSYSFVTMPISDDYAIDIETQRTLDALIGADLDEFVRLVLQSNNNVTSKEACRSCGIYALFSAIKKHHALPVDEIIVLQKMLANLYQFVQTTKSLSKKPFLLIEQYQALQDLNRSQAEQNNKNLQARRAATSAALKKLQSIEYYSR